MRNIAWAMELLASGHPNTQSSFTICYAWCFEVEGVRYRLAEMKGHYVELTEVSPPKVLERMNTKIEE